MKRFAWAIVTAALLGTSGHAAAAPKDTYAATCAACHANGVANAPKPGDTADWQRRLQRAGQAGLIESALKGRGAMPAKGGNAGLSDEDVRATVLFMLGAAAAPAASAAKAAPAAAASPVASAPAAGGGKATYDLACAPCHQHGLVGAPKLDDGAAWAPRLTAGLAQLQQNAISGKGAMPPKGANPNLSDAQVRAAVEYMVAQAQAKAGAASKPAVASAAPVAAAAAAPAPAARPAVAAAPAAAGKGQGVYQSACMACHGSGVAGAPKLGDAAAWGPRIKAGTAGLYTSALKGKGAMPAKGGQAALADADVRAAVDYMVAQSGGGASAPAATPAAAAPAKPAASAPAAVAAAAAPVATPNPAASAAAPSPASAAPTAAAPSAAEAAQSAEHEVNAFNRLLRPPGRRNLPPTQDGIHDPTNDGTLRLQPPLDAYALLPRSASGNQVDWVKALTDKRIRPRADRLDPKVDMAVMDLNIVREVKGSMPDVVYPHKQHTEWLDCSNCHPAIFIPQKGANQISMASILLGQKCGVCHGKVAFPVSECRACHSRKKTSAVAQGGEAK
jgi:c(7)-type cytochrome triheme protein